MIIGLLRSAEDHHPTPTSRPRRVRVKNQADCCPDQNEADWHLDLNRSSRPAGDEATRESGSLIDSKNLLTLSKAARNCDSSAERRRCRAPSPEASRGRAEGDKKFERRNARLAVMDGARTSRPRPPGSPGRYAGPARGPVRGDRRSAARRPVPGSNSAGRDRGLRPRSISSRRAPAGGALPFPAWPGAQGARPLLS